MLNLASITKQVCQLASETGKFLVEKRQSLSALNIEIKGKNDFVTNFDKESEKRIVEGLKNLIPDAGFIAEEGTSTKVGDEYNWIIDPIDGTTNFIHGLTPFAISIGLERNKKMVMGVVYEAGLNELFYAYEGSKAFLNGKEISVSKAPTIGDSLIATGFPYTNYSRIKPFMETLEYFMTNSHGIRRIGTAATDLIYVACGRFDAFYEYDLKPWDVAAGAFIVQQAGGKLSDFSGGDNYIYGKEMIATNNLVFDEFLSTIKNIMTI